VRLGLGVTVCPCGDRNGGGRFSATICPGGDRKGGLFDLVDRHRPRAQEVDHNTDPARKAALAPLPAPDASGGDIEHLRDAALREAELGEHRAEFGCGRGALGASPEVFSWAGRCFFPFWVA